MRLEILKDGDERLRRIAPPVVRFGEELATFAASMIETMDAEKGIGLAAPQVGCNMRLIVIRPAGKAQVLVNPLIVDCSTRRVKGPEGCLSCPGVSRKIERAPWVDVEYQDTHGGRHMIRMFDLHAIVVQHEIDHLNGKLITDWPA